MQNGFYKRFNGRMHDEILNETMFRNMADAGAVIRAWAASMKHDRIRRPIASPRASLEGKASRSIDTEVKSALRTQSSVN